VLTGTHIVQGVALAGLLALSNCRQTEPVEEPVTSTHPAEVVTAPTPATQPAAVLPSAADERGALRFDSHHGWLRIDQLYDDVDGGWVTGDVDKPRNRITIETNNTRQFTMDLSTLPIRWDRLVVLRINDQTMELTRKERSRVTFEQTRTGAWDVVSE
jgi:hypothetical protein